MKRHIARITLVVRDYDEAIAFYVGAVGFHLVEDKMLAPGKRWVVVAPTASCETALLLAQADGPEQEAAIGNQSGGRVGFFLYTDDIARDRADMSAKGVRFLEETRHEAYGSVAVFADLHGNLWDLLQPRN